MAIQNRRGAYADFDKSKMVAGEIAVVQSGDPNSTDGSAVYVATQAGNAKRLSTYEDMQNEIVNATSEIEQQLVTEFEQDIADDLAAAQQAVTDASTQAQAASTSASTASTKASEAAASATQAAQTVENIIDSTLTQTGKAADAKKVGDEITDLKDDLTNDIEDTVGLLRYNLFKNVLYYKNLNGVQRGVAMSGCTATTDGNTITLTATSATVRLGSAGSSNDNFNTYGFGYPISCVGASKLRFILSDGFIRNYVTFWDSTGGFVSLSSVQTSNDFTLEVPSGAYICTMRFDLLNATVGNTYKLTVKVFSELSNSVMQIVDGIADDVDAFKAVKYSVYGGYISSTGAVVIAGNDTREVYSDFIPASNGDTFEFKLENSTQVSMWAALCQYDKNRNFISRTNLTANSTLANFETTIAISDVNTQFIVLTYRTYGTISATLKTTESTNILSDRVDEAQNIPFHSYNVKGINHRGFNSIAPENTIPAFVESKKHGFAYVETDVSVTSDGVFVLLHDATINRTARNADGTAISGTVNISDITYEQALTYDFGIYKGDKYAGTKIPTLEEFIKFCKFANLKAYIELKNTATYTQEQVSAMVLLAKKYGMESNVTWISFTKDYLVYVLNANNKARVGYIADGSYPTKLNDAISLKTDDNDVFLDVYIGNIYDEVIDSCISADIPVEAWTIDTTAQLLSMNPYITGVTTDYLDVSATLYYSQI